MNALTLFALQAVIYASFPYYFATLRKPVREVSFYVYTGIILAFGGFLGSVYAFPITKTTSISGGNLAYGALMMTTILLVIIEKKPAVIRNVIRLVITVNVFVVLFLTTLTWALQNAQILNPNQTSFAIFQTSVFFTILGGILIIVELLLLVVLFEKAKQWVTNIFGLTVIYTILFILVLCLDGVLFPTIAFGFSPVLVKIVIGGVKGKFIMAATYSPLIFGFLLVFRHRLTEYIEKPLNLRELFRAPKEVLVAEIERQRAELEKAHQRYQILFTRMNEGFARAQLIVDAQGKPSGWEYFDINPAFEKQTGLARQYVIGKSITQVLPGIGPSIAQWIDARGEVAPAGAEGVLEEYSGPLDRWYQANVFFPAPGEFAATFTDITDRKQRELDRELYSKQLEMRVAERTATVEQRISQVETLNLALANVMDDLQSAKLNAEDNARRLAAVNAEIESFSYSVSHDLRAPLRAISGFSEIIARRHRTDLNDEGQHYVDNIVQASARMGQLIDDLLTYSRLGRDGIRRQPISLADLMPEIGSNLGSLVSASHGTLKFVQGLPTVMGDHTLLSQIFTNLLENGLKYNRPDVAPQVSVAFRVDTAEEATIRPPAPLAPQPWGEQSTASPRIGLGGRGAEDLPEDQYVVVSVADNGIGIPAEYQDKIFNIFQRLHSEEEYPGTGIGLATVRKAVDLLGGKVWVASQVGQGSTFWVKLPKG